MNDLLQRAITAHGGLAHFQEFQTVSADVSIGGALWAMKGRPPRTNAQATVDLRRERAEFTPFGGPISAEYSHRTISRSRRPRVQSLRSVSILAPRSPATHLPIGLERLGHARQSAARAPNSRTARHARSLCASGAKSITVAPSVVRSGLLPFVY